MRLHRLRLQAFGPFAGVEEIDFDALSADGLHLIHGATGAGKTSILDAICFALFAGVPGGRAGGRDSLHSDHAAPTTRPGVELDFGVGDRRLRVRRSPEHLVPKKRGTGTRAQRGSVHLEELRSGRWTTVATRADEAAQLIGDLLGMGLPQFAQVMLLPQGEFTAFLRAKADDRGKLLERLFDISEFAEIERWLIEHRKALDTQVALADARRAELVSRAQDALGAIPFDAAVPCAVGAADSVDGLRRLGTELSERLTVALAEADAANARVDTARARLAEERSLAAWQHQARSAQQTLDRLAAQATAIARSAERLDLTARAEVCRPALATVARRRTAHRENLSAADRARAALVKITAWTVPQAHAHDVLTEAAIDPLRERAAGGSDALAGQPELLRRLRSVQSESHSATAAGSKAATEVARATRLVDAGTIRLAELTRLRETQLPLAGALPQWRALVDSVDAAREAATLAARELDRVQDAGTTHRAARREWMRLEDALLKLRRARLDGIAAELAGELVDGQPCPVCGSPAHPHAAEPAAHAVDADHIEAAEGAVTTASAAAQSAAAGWSAAVGRAQTRCHALLEAVDGFRTAEPLVDADEEVAVARESVADVMDGHRAELGAVAAALDAASPATDESARLLIARLIDALGDSRGTLAQRVTAATAAAEQLRTLDLQLETLRAEHLAAERAAATAAANQRAALALQESLQRQLAETRGRLADLTAAHDESCGCAGDAADVREAHLRCVRSLDQLLAATSAAHIAAQELTSAQDELARVLSDQEFPDADGAIAAMLTPQAQHELRAAVEQAEADRLKATGILEQPEVAAAAASDPAEVDRIAAETAAAEATARHTHDAVGDLRRALQALERIAAELEAHDRHSGPLRDQLAVATSLASAVTGSGDNAMRMRLTAYVLAARLETVTALANERLAVMTGGRYQLEHTDAKAGRGKSGLGLQVRDAWTGTTRDTGTLSGGESFIASLALALGLGDAVLQAAGGRHLETLLVDEGFGSLDEDSLEQVLDVLDALRAGGRSVGIVSHVAELRGRIPSQIRVHKTSTGSTLEVITPDVA